MLFLIISMTVMPFDPLTHSCTHNISVLYLPQIYNRQPDSAFFYPLYQSKKWTSLKKLDERDGDNLLGSSLI